ncbi:ETS-related transcription factor Elf-5-like [Neocloeon triangulifer]|uniref:ETS-related transcription factor Elf-5-like n=1 Tax=Neocloeon triangulifer TaxID=2078957 RepID=UPI00286F483D|nr:ETS-related transcription factor Elf-5-like [Neocloeon triangulifer]
MLITTASIKEISPHLVGLNLQNLSNQSNDNSDNCGPHKPHTRLIIWEFLLDALRQPRLNPSAIHWVNFEVGTFKIVDGVGMAQEWKLARGKGAETEDTKKAADNFCRSMRYHYQTGCLHRVSEKKVYRFGAKTEWRRVQEIHNSIARAENNIFHFGDESSK